MDQASWLTKIIAAGMAGILALWLSLPEAVRILCGLMVLDYATGMIVAYKTKTVSSSAGMRGLATKVLMLILIGASHWAAVIIHLGEGVSDWLSSGIALFFVLNEFISIVENCHEGGVNIPPRLIDALDQAKQLGGWDGKEERRVAPNPEWPGMERRG